MKNILIPVRNAETAVQLFRLTSRLFPQDTVHCRFLAIRKMPDNDHDLLTLSLRSDRHDPFTNVFSDAAGDIAKQSAGRISYCVDHIYGDSPYVFRSYAGKHDIAVVIYDKDEWKDCRRKYGLNVFSMIVRSGCEVMYVSAGALLRQESETAGGDKGHSQLNGESENNGSYYLQPAPATVQYQFQAVQKRLNQLQAEIDSHRFMSRKLGNLSRYFLTETGLQKSLDGSGNAVLWIKNS